MRIASFSDVHLDDRATVDKRILLSPSGQNVRFQDRVRCLESCVDGILQYRPTLTVCAGDLFERNKPTPAEYVAASSALDRLAEQGPVILLGDNHGMVEQTAAAHAIAPLERRRPNLHVCLAPTVIRVAHQRLQVAVCPPPKRSPLVERTEDPHAADVVLGQIVKKILWDLYAQCDHHLPSILVSHMLVQEASIGSGAQILRPGMLSVDDLPPFTLSILGDCHKYQVLRNGTVLIPGSTDRCNFGEQHDAKGWVASEWTDVWSHQVYETPARSFMTYTPDALPDQLQTGDVEWGPIVRVKGTVSQEEYDQLQAKLLAWRAYPLFVEDLEITRQTRARSERMTDALSLEEQLVEWATVNKHVDEIPVLVDHHRRLMG